MIEPLRCWKCSSLNVAEKLTRVGRVRTTAEQIQQGAEDENMYQRFNVCGDCEYRWSPHADRYLRMIVFRRERNDKIADLAARFAMARQSCFVYVERVEHVELLGLMCKDALSRAGIDPSLCRIVHGELDDKENSETKALFSGGRLLVVVGNTVWGEGTDIPCLRWVINGAAGLPGIALEQLIGRGLRIAKGKRRAGFVDFLDEHDKTFAGRSRKRLDFLRTKGFPVSVLRPIPSKNAHRKYRR